MDGRNKRTAETGAPRALQGVSVIIPAFDEEQTIVRVIRTAEWHPLVDQVIVVSDGSTDRTVANARQTSAYVIELNENLGKGFAMDIGVRRSSGDVIVFLDADLLGLTADLLTALIEPVLSGAYDMFTLVKSRRFEPFQRISTSLVLGGERAMRRDFWESVPEAERQGFDVEIALNHYAKEMHKKTGIMYASKLTHTPKERKHGFVRGLGERMAMIADCTTAYWRLKIMDARHSLMQMDSMEEE